MMDLPGNRFQASPLPRDDLDGMIRFCHPGYSGPPASNTFLSLPRVDPAGRNIFGVHYYTALAACQIIANNAFRPSTRLTLDRAGERPAVAQWDSVLTERFYYFHVGHGLTLYPIVPSFRDWEFPHDRLHEVWPNCPTLPPMPGRCAVTNISSTEHAYLVPKEEVAWYNYNAMHSHAGVMTNPDIDNKLNKLCLRPDMRQYFDRGLFAIAPKASAIGVPPQYVTHIMSAEASEIWPDSHNLVAQHVRNASQPYLFARFAWAVLADVKHFLVLNDVSRKVVQLELEKGSRGEYVERLMMSDELKAIYDDEPVRSSGTSSAGSEYDMTDLEEKDGIMEWDMTEDSVSSDPTSLEMKGLRKDEQISP